nr:hypothetical protein BaRGS_032977 [Batillaria attramentaria]
MPTGVFRCWDPSSSKTWVPGRGNGITAQRYMDQVLHPHVLPFFQAHGNWVFQHDNARPHTARATQDLLQRSGTQWTLWTQLDDLDFVDDLALLSHNHSQMQDKTTCLEATSVGTGLNINRKKTELMKINTTANTPVTVGGEPIREVESFVYLGSAVDGQGGTDRDVTARIGKARAAMIMLKNIWASKVISTRTKLRIFNSNVKSVLLYRCETWRINKDDAAEDPDIFQHLSETYLQHPMAREDQK